MNSQEGTTGGPLTDDERAGLRREIDADALSRLLVQVDPEMRQLILALVQRHPPRDTLLEAARNVLGEVAAGHIAEHGPKAAWIEFPQPEQNRLWHQALGLSAV